MALIALQFAGSKKRVFELTYWEWQKLWFMTNPWWLINTPSKHSAEHFKTSMTVIGLLVVWQWFLELTFNRYALTCDLNALQKTLLFLNGCLTLVMDVTLMKMAKLTCLHPWSPSVKIFLSVKSMKTLARSNLPPFPSIISWTMLFLHHKTLMFKRQTKRFFRKCKMMKLCAIVPTACKTMEKASVMTYLKTSSKC